MGYSVFVQEVLSGYIAFALGVVFEGGEPRTMSETTHAITCPTTE